MQKASLKRCRYSGSSLGLQFSTSFHLIRKKEIFRTSIDDRSILSLRSVSIIFWASASSYKTLLFVLNTIRYDNAQSTLND